MARYPAIDSPCPLSVDAQRCIDGFCGRCGKTVHRLDGMNDDARTALLAAASGPVCVAYSVRRPGGMTALLCAATMATALVAPPTLAGEGVASTEQATDSSGALEVDEFEMLEFIFVGGIAEPGAAEWIDESDLPELPIVYDESDPDAY